jgi:hypothetical protein
MERIQEPLDVPAHPLRLQFDPHAERHGDGTHYLQRQSGQRPALHARHGRCRDAGASRQRKLRQPLPPPERANRPTQTQIVHGSMFA